MEYPLEWNDSQTYTYNLKADVTQIFLLRDHITLMQDLVSDWGNDLEPNIMYFVPCTYHIRVIFTQLEWFFCVNDHNVINLANDRDDNGNHVHFANIAL
jgi:hypothetical protein